MKRVSSVLVLVLVLVLVQNDTILLYCTHMKESRKAVRIWNYASRS